MEEKKIVVKTAIDTALTEKMINVLLKPVYDTMNLKPIPEMDEEITLSRSDIKRFTLRHTKFAAMAVENRYPFAGASIGHCDLFIFRFNGEKWETADFMREAGSGGMYGNSGSLTQMVRIGKEAVVFALAGGQTHMGTLYYDDLVLFRHGRLQKAGMVETQYSYGDWDDDAEGTRFCFDIQYEFLPSGKPVYDLQLVKRSCLKEDQNKILDKIIVPFSDKNNRYEIPETFTESLP
ncbi:hypothetical protein [Chryseobacterium hagamense]|uniref:Uncharacterized protein n=1 Tax=Chryseobacterium hagamense TaxID=395935 RepID=A0A511YSB7_9FLAO|nr:hypothetical protein [Chryseobacterium hagamense]GEN78082.1 hypothetical protein CHA01nite_38220 [Chryseobacterium hagamense]